MKFCPKCQKQHTKTGVFCSRSCANSRGPRTQEFKEKVARKLLGKKVHTDESIRKGILTKGLTYWKDTPETICMICGKNTGTHHRKTCSKDCMVKLCRKQSSENPRCGGQKHTHRTKFSNIKNEEFSMESSFEVRLAEILNKLSIYWKRPSFFWYKEKNRKRRYYPDFYIPEKNIYLDPKNSFLIKSDIKKIHKATDENDIFVVVIGEQSLNEKDIKGIISMKHASKGVLISE